MTTFSVVIPTRNRTQALCRCLASMAELDYPVGEWELIVVNDGGTAWETAVKNYEQLTINNEQLTMNNEKIMVGEEGQEVWETAVSPDLLVSLPIQTVTITHAGPAAARNAGARLAHGRYLAFTDDDCVVEPDWLSQLAAGFAQTGAQALGGQTRNPFPESRAAVGAQLLVDFLYDHLQTADGCPVLLVANNAAYETAVFRQIGGYDERFRLAAAEDWEIGYRLLAAGFRQAYFPAAQVTHFHRQTWRGHWKQQVRYGRGGSLLRSLPETVLLQSKTTHFIPALVKYLQEKGASWSVIGGVIGGQLSYRLGHWFQSAQKWRGVLQTAVQ